MFDQRFPVRSEFRDYQIARTFGWTLDQINDQPAVWLDWLLMIDGKVREAEARASSGIS